LKSAGGWVYSRKTSTALPLADVERKRLSTRFDGVRAPFPSRSASALFFVGAATLVVGFVVIFAGPLYVGALIGFLGFGTAYAASWLNHRQNPPAETRNQAN
jgi:hypothetical protein